MPEEGRGTFPTHGIQQVLNVHALHERERGSELSYVVYLNFSVRVSFKDNTANESRQHKDGEGGTRARREQGADTRRLRTIEIKLHVVYRAQIRPGAIRVEKRFNVGVRPPGMRQLVLGQEGLMRSDSEFALVCD